MKIAIIGAGYVGLTSGAVFSYIGHDVSVIEVDGRKVEMLRSGECPFHEPHLKDLLSAAPSLKFATEYEGVASADAIFLAVGTPQSSDLRPDMSYLRAAVQKVGERLGSRPAVVVNKSTVPVGSGQWVEGVLRESARSSKEFSGNRLFVASNPEFLREGSAVHDALYPDRIVLGTDSPATLDVLCRIYAPIIAQSFRPPDFLPRPDGIGRVPVLNTSRQAAELIKYAANSFLALKISFINEIARLAEAVGADILDVARGVGLDNRIGGQFLQAGIGWGGSCFSKDTAALLASARERGIAMPIVEAARSVNEQQRELAVQKLFSELKTLQGRTIGLLGLAFKENTDDLRDAPALEIARRLVSLGANVRAHDPAALTNARKELRDIEITLCEAAGAAAKDADALVLVTPWPEYRDISWRDVAAIMRQPLIVDTRNYLSREMVQRHGFRYLGIGR